MAITLIGHYDSPFVRRVGVSLHILGMPFERQLLSVFSHAVELRAYNPVGRVPALVLDGARYWSIARRSSTTSTRSRAPSER